MILIIFRIRKNFSESLRKGINRPSSIINSSFSLVRISASEQEIHMDCESYLNLRCLQVNVPFYCFFSTQKKKKKVPFCVFCISFSTVNNGTDTFLYGRKFNFYNCFHVNVNVLLSLAIQ